MNIVTQILVEFVGGPLDGTREMHPMQNCWGMEIEGAPDGAYYINPYDGKMYWIVPTKF